MKILISPHNDDETLFCSWTILREKPLVVIVTDSARQASKGITAEQRRAETKAAMDILGVEVRFLGIPDNKLELAPLWAAVLPEAEHIWIPAYEEGGNVDHNVIATSQFLQNLAPHTHYMTYTNRGKSVGVPVPYEREWVALKLKAMACYRSQILEPSCSEHFIRDLREYYAETN